MKHILKKTFLTFVFVLSSFLIAELVLLPLLLTLVFNSVFPTYFSFFTDWFALCLSIVSGSVAASLFFCLWSVIRTVKRGRAIVRCMATSGVTFDEAVIIVDHFLYRSDDPGRWNPADFTKTLWKHRSMGRFN